LLEITEWVSNWGLEPDARLLPPSSLSGHLGCDQMATRVDVLELTRGSRDHQALISTGEFRVIS
jgi:hypothetical protein